MGGSGVTVRILAGLGSGGPAPRLHVLDNTDPMALDALVAAGRTIESFSGTGDNPCPAELAQTSVRRLHAWAGLGFTEHGIDSDHVLGSDGTVTERAWEAALLRVQGVPAARSLGGGR
jgi:hypothetical protein